MAAQSLVLPSLAPRIRTILSKPKTLTLTLTLKPSLSSKPSLSACHSFLPSRNGRRRSGYGVARYSEVSSELEVEQGEEPAPAPPPQQQSFSPDLKLYVGNLPFSVDSSELAALFDSVGTVEVVEVIYDKLTGRSRGFGFVTMSSIEEVEAAVQQFNGYELSGRSLRVNSGPPPPRDEFSSRTPQARGSFGSSNRVYVGNLPWSAEDESLGALFSEHGQVIEAKVVYDRETGRSRGFGFVTYSSAAEVDSAISSLDGSDFDGRQIRVSVAEDKPRRF